MSERPLYQLNPRKKATELLTQSQSYRLIGTITTYTRKGTRKIQQIMLENGIAKINGQITYLTFENIAAINWQPVCLS